MFNTRDLLTPISFSKDLINDQTPTGLVFELNSASAVFDANGLGPTTNTSVILTPRIGWFSDQSITSTMKFLSATTLGNEQLGVMLRFRSNTVPYVEYYYVRLRLGEARISKVSLTNHTTTDISTASFPIAQDQEFTIAAQVIGNVISATFTATSGSPSPVNISAIDSEIAIGGLGLRTTTSTGKFKNVSINQLV